MPGQPYRVEVEAIHWPTLLPSLRLFESFRLAIHPSKLLLAYGLVLLLYLVGLGLDLVWGAAGWAEGGIGGAGVFAAALAAEVEAFRAAVGSAIGLDFGFRDFLAGAGRDSGGVIGAAGDMLIGIPGALWAEHPAFLLVYGLIAYLLTALFGGAIARLAALHACRDRRPAPDAGLRFVAQRFIWFVLLPLLPLIVAAGIALLLALAGLIFFNAPFLDVIGGLLYGPLLLGGFVIALILLGLLIAGHVLYPALAVEGTDAFDAVSRAYNYVIGRPLRFLLYVAVAIVYFALSFLFVGLIVYWTAWATEATVGAWTFTEASGAGSVTRFEAQTPDLIAHGPSAGPRWAALDGPGTVAAGLIQIWTSLLLLLLPAFAVSFYFSVATWVYLLLRRAADGVEFEDIYLDATSPAAATPDTLEAPDAPDARDQSSIQHRDTESAEEKE